MKDVTKKLNNVWFVMPCFQQFMRGKKTYNWSYCDYRGSHKPHLNAHMQSNHKLHDGREKNKCAICATTFSKRIGLTRHLKNVHARE